MRFRVYDKQEKKYVDLKNNPLWMDNEGDFYFISDLPCCSCEGMSFYSDRYVVERFMITHINGDIELDLYVGDIVYIAGKGNCVVVYDENACCFYFEKDGEYYEYQDEIEDIEKIIGNIHGEADDKI